MGSVCIKGTISFLACEQAHFCELGKNFGCGSASMQGKVTFPRTMVGHFCEFGKNFGHRSASMQGKVTFPCTMVGHFCEFGGNFGGRSASTRKSDFYSHHGGSAAEIFPQTSTNGTSESACRIVVSWCLYRCNQQWHNSVVPHHNKNDTEQNCHTTMQHLTNNGFRTTKKHPGLGSMYANEWVHAFFCCFIMLLPFPLSRPMLASINFQFSQNTYPKKILAHVILHIVHKWWKRSNVMWTRFQSYS